MTSDDNDGSLRHRNARFARLGLIAGIIMGVVGTGAGFYFGVVAPAIESGSWQGLSPHVLLAGAGLLLALILGVSVYCWYYMRRNPQVPDTNADDW
ncbi:MAG: hypothetical protein GX761_05290 [Gammaproteobacteria bacterium]|nr:hypothetical protein [Gammaproteobacteria bacterium]